MKSLANKLDDDYNWRMKEIAILRAQALKSPEGSGQRQVMLRALWMMLYAHYEGYCKATWDLYLESIEREKIPCNQLIDDLAILTLKSKIKDLRTSAAIDIYKIMVGGFPGASSNASFNEKHDEISNLPPDILEGRCKLYGLEVNTINEGNNKMFLWRLVKNRHKIAHGNNYEIKSMNDYEMHEDVATGVMTELALSVLDVIENKKFKKV